MWASQASRQWASQTCFLEPRHQLEEWCRQYILRRIKIWYPRSTSTCGLGLADGLDQTVRAPVRIQWLRPSCPTSTVHLAQTQGGLIVSSFTRQLYLSVLACRIQPSSTQWSVHRTGKCPCAAFVPCSISPRLRLCDSSHHTRL
jgi:hypothetical protein